MAVPRDARRQVGDPVAVTERTEHRRRNRGQLYRERTQYRCGDGRCGAEPQWTKIVEARQEAALVLTAGYYWAKGNVTLMDGNRRCRQDVRPRTLFPSGQQIRRAVGRRFVRRNGLYAEAVQVALADIPTASRIPIRAR
ncbi:MAG: hypothetical protein ACLRM8_07395 [Alistipes sp.]